MTLTETLYNDAIAHLQEGKHIREIAQLLMV